MVNKTIYNSLKKATEKGEALRQAMTSLYSSGYSKKEIEEAARTLQKEIAKEQILRMQQIQKDKKMRSTPQLKQALFEGLKRAVKKGEALRQAMMSFYNAGYPKEEIEEAARELQAERARERELDNLNRLLNII